jgi:hypothetical protein
MNQQQRSYALNRINEIQKEKVAAIKARFTMPAKKLEGEEFVSLIRAGKVKLRADAQYYHDLNKAFDFSKYEHAERYDSTKGDPIIFKVEKEAGKAKDIVMFTNEEPRCEAAIANFIAQIDKL